MSASSPVLPGSLDAERYVNYLSTIYWSPARQHLVPVRKERHVFFCLALEAFLENWSRLAICGG